MYRSLMIAALLAAAPFAAAQQTARIAGSVVSTGGGPVRRAVVRLQGNAAGNTPVFVAIADPAGAFAFGQVPPGRYLLSAQKPGFAPGRYAAGDGQAQITLGAGTTISDAVIRLEPLAVISGQVLNADGEPAFGAHVRVMSVTAARGGLRLTPGNAAQVDDRGQFRIVSLTPGRYYLMAEDTSSRQVATQRGVAAGVFEVDLPTYYPGGTDVLRAAAVEAKAGEELSGIQIRMQRGRLFAVRGRVFDASGQPAAVTLSMGPKAAGGLAAPASYQASSRAETGGLFEFLGVLPGEYVIQASPVRAAAVIREGANTRAAPPNPAAGSSGRLEVYVGGSDVESLLLALQPNVAVAGRVVGDAGSLPGSYRPAVSLTPADAAAPGPTRATADVDGAFRIDNVSTVARYNIGLMPLPAGMYIKTVRWAGSDVTHSALDFSSGAGTLEIVLAAGAAEVSGSLRNAAGEPRSGVLVALWPKAMRGSEANGGVRLARTDQQGAFRLTGLPPDEYHLAAFEDTNQAFLQVYEFLARFNPAALEVQLSSGASPALEPKLISRDEVNAQMARLP